MEYLFALFVVLVTVGYAVIIAVNVSKGKPWALQIAQAVSLLNPNAPDFGRYQQMSEQVPSEIKAVTKADETVAPEKERLAA